MSTPLARTVIDTAGPSAPAVVLLHSLGAARRMWAPQLETLAERFRLVAPDLRGHGESPAPAGPYAMADLGGDVLALLDELDIEKAHVVGISLGGGIAQWLAAHAPDRVDALVLISTAARFGRPQDMRNRAAAVRAGGTAAVAATVVGRWFTAPLAEEEPGLPALFREIVAATDDEGYASCCEALAEWDGRDDLARITARTLVLSADQDTSTAPVVVAEVAEGIAGAELVTLSPAAHLVTLELADAVDDLLVRFLTTS